MYLFRFGTGFSRLFFHRKEKPFLLSWTDFVSFDENDRMCV